MSPMSGSVGLPTDGRPSPSPGEDLHGVPVRVVEVDPAAAPTVVDLPGTATHGLGIEGRARGTDAVEAQIELVFGDQEGVVLRLRVRVPHVVERDSVGQLDR